ncbi:methionyl-tRNA formyltransferase [Dactylosporangium aurantiacum]|uniref:Methionyl-tRNA formyltransferase n=1 Tax=Dactylosporangium aurantiacum TaxID=35754 RepID=A0A9Q9IF37_9ACTN|nr:methionyl-tRNA formyltransferase [Dactylosporangium aurantiacum]MDG6102902.1 methionyl-tRNA formyltransferase [Dactylosporangium aurantiacum]UWZ52867.1 methionyl-tRNA formyltransferase [Dactylosporangium aurantiacum]
MRLVFAGTPAVAVPALDAIAASSHELVAVVTRPDAPSGRGRQLVPSPVSAWAQERGIPVLTPARPREPEFLERLRALEPDCAPVVAYGALVPRVALDIPRYGWINLHFSLLPAWRGAAPVQHAVLHGDDMTGASVFLLEEGLDTGPVFGTLTEPVGARDTSGDLLDRLAVSGAGLLVQVLDGIEAHTVGPVPQPHEGVSTAPKLTVDDALVRWADPAFAVDRRVRACTPAPGAWTTLRGDRLKLGPVTPVTAASVIGGGAALGPGVVAVERNRVLVGTGTVPVVLGTVTAPGKKAMPADAWARGARIESGAVLGVTS